MATDNRSEISDCDSDSSNWSGDSTVSDNSDIKYEGTGSISVQATNSYRGWWRDLSPSVDLSSSTIYAIIKPNNPDTKTNGGVRFVLGDGTNMRAYYVGGSDDLGFLVKGGWSVYRLDTANLPASYSQETGSAAPSLTAITDVGMGVLSASKAIGNVVNTFIDRISYISNTSAAFTVNAGTSGTPITFATLVSDDETNGWGFFNNPISGSKQYGVYGSIDWGDSGTGDSYFDDSDAQVYFVGTGLSSGTMNQDFISNSTGTNSFVLDNCTLVHVGEDANWNFDSANFDVQKITGTTFLDSGTITMHSTNDSTNRYFIGCQFIGCEQVDPNKTKVRTSLFKSTADSTSALLWDNNGDIQDCSFEDNTTGAAIEHETIESVYAGNCTNSGSETTTLYDSGGGFNANVNVGDYIYNETDGCYGQVTVKDSDTQLTHVALAGGTNNYWTNNDAYSISPAQSYTDMVFSGNTTDVDNNATGSDGLFISKAGTSDPSTSEGNVVFLGAVTITITVYDKQDGLVEQNVQTAVYKISDRSELMNEDTNASGVATESYTGSTPVDVEVRCRKASSGSDKFKNYSSKQTISSDGLTLTVTLDRDPNNNATS